MTTSKWAMIGGTFTALVLAVGLTLAIVSPKSEEAQKSESGTYSYSDCMDDLYPKAGDASDIETLNIMIAAAERACEDLK